MELITATAPYPNYISVYEVLEKVIRDCNIKSTDEFNIDWFIEWILEAEEHIGSTAPLINKNDKIQVSNKMAMFPCDVYKLIMVSVCNTGQGLLEDSSHFSSLNGMLYVLNDTNIQVDLPDGTLLSINYYAIPVDKDGIPLIKNTIHHREAIVAYCVMKWYYRNYLDNQMQPSVWKDRERDWYVKRDKAQTKDSFPSLAKMENIKRMWMRLLPQTDSYYHSFINRGLDTNFHNNG
jgi:hypothetical protein